MRRAARVDDNQAEIVAAFRKLGCSVLDMSALGGGKPDLLVGCGGLNICVEVKDGAKSPSRRALRPLQRDFRDNWTGGLRIVENLADVTETVSTLRLWHRRLAGWVDCS